MCTRVCILVCVLVSAVLSGCQAEHYADVKTATTPAPGTSAVFRLSHGARDERVARVEAWVAANRDRPPMLRAFTRRMPKGGDIHTHLSGAVYAESYLEWAAASEFCADTDALVLLPPPCTADQTDSNLPAADLLENANLRDTFINNLSTRNLSYAGQSGHDQFFQAFGAFDSVSSAQERGDYMVAEVANRAASQHIGYLEIMVTFEGSAVRRLGARKPWTNDTNLESRRQWLLDNGLRERVATARAELDRLDRQYDTLMKCDSLSPQPGCSVTIRLLAQTTRTKPPEQVYAQLVHAFELVAADWRVVGLNLVAPEDHPVALRDYALHMQMIGFLAAHYPNVKVALHAGELSLGLVRPEALRSHIRQAVEVAGAHRIGHGVDIMYEDDPMQLLQRMREKAVLVEICLTSNDVILEVAGDDHPFQDYRNAGVPLTLASDDEGVSRIDLSNEYVRAMTTYDLNYADLKQLSRNSLEYSFLAGGSLWTQTRPFVVVSACTGEPIGNRSPSPSCDEFLEANDKARAQWRLEGEFAEFERLAWFH